MRRTRILLIDPTDPWVTNNDVLKHHDQVMLPIGLMSLSAFVKARFATQVEVRVISTIVDLEQPDDLDAIVRDFSPDIIGVRCVVFYAERVEQIVASCRALCPSALIVAGGPNVTFDNQRLLKNPAIDVLVGGEGEETLAELVKHFLEGGRAKVLQAAPKIAGTMIAQGEVVVSAPARVAFDALDELPIPDYQTIDLEKYRKFLNYGYNRRRMGILFTSRGCPFRCTYCHVSFGKGFRARSPESIHREVVRLHDEYGIRDFSIVDDNFTVDRHRVDAFTRLMIADHRKVRFYFPNGVRADSLDGALLEKLRDAGTIYVTYSLETASSRLQELTKKRANIEKLTKIVHRSCELGIVTNLCMMVGFPSETLAEAEASLDYFEQFDRLFLPYYFAVKYYPGTELFQTADQFGIVINPESHQAPYHGYEFQETPLISRADFERLNLRYLRKIYLNPTRIRNALGILRGHFDDAEINDMYTLFFRRRINNIETDVLAPLTPAVVRT